MMRDQKELLLIYAGKEEVFRQPPRAGISLPGGFVKLPQQASNLFSGRGFDWSQVAFYGPNRMFYMDRAMILLI